MSFKRPIAIFGDLVEIVNEKSKAENASLSTYISTENMLVDFGGVKTAASLPTSGGVTKFRAGDVLFSNIRTYFKKVWMASFDGNCSNDVLVFRSKDDKKLIPSYLHNLCRWDKFTEFSVRTSKGAKMPRGDKDALILFEFPLPTTDEQIAIAALLSSLDERITLLRETNTTLEAIAQALFKSWFVDFDPVRAKSEGKLPEGMDEATAALFPDSFEETELGLMPKGWEVKALGDLIVPKRGKTITKAKCVEGDIPVVAGGLEPAYFHNQSNVSSPVATISASGANAGFVRLYQQDIWASDCSFVSLEQTDSIYFWYVFLKASQEKIYFMQQGAAQPHIYPSDLMRLNVYSSSVGEERVVFNKLVSPLFEKTALVTAKIKTLADLRDTLLPRLISGQLRIADAEAELEKVTA